MTIMNGARFRALSIISITVIVVLLLLTSAGQASLEGTATEPYRVRSGDTLWQIAGDLGPEDRDRREVVAVIQRINDLGSEPLQIGQILEIPVVDT
ncbi:MAG: LysM peptidoglycan-binding domain-containing protein [Acidimicrobiia bacterium]